MSCCVIFTRDDHLSAEALSMCFRHPRLRLRVLMCFVSVITPRNRMTQLRIQRTTHLPRRPAEIYTPLPPRRTLKDRDSDIMAYPLSNSPSKTTSSLSFK
jgi:hypothetical protein